MRQFTVDEIERAFLKRKNEQRASEMQRILQTELEVLGLTRDDILDVLHEMRPHLPEVEEEFIWLNLLQDLWENSYFEARLLALEVMYAKSDLIDAHLWGMLDHWTNGIDNWLLADWLGHLRAIAIYKAHTLVMRMAPWLQSGDPWRRRSAIVSLLYIDPETQERRLLLEPHEIFAFVDPALTDESDAVQKALTWLFRQINTHYPEELSTFLRRYRDRISPNVIENLSVTGSAKNAIENAYA
ncbi:MAG: DNA alkylation repair protein [bacterium]